MNRKIIAVIILAVALGTVWYLTAGKPPLSAEAPPPARPAAGVLLGNTLPEFQLLSLEGNKLTVGAPGKVTVLNFWATWCPPCRAEMPELDTFAGKYGSIINFYAVNIQESQETVAGFMKQNNLQIPVLLDKDGSVARTFRVSAIPTTVIADKQGVIRFRKSGTVTSAELEDVIKAL